MMFIRPLVSLSKGVEVRSHNSQILKPTPNFGFQYDHALLLTEKVPGKTRWRRFENPIGSMQLLCLPTFTIIFSHSCYGKYTHFNGSYQNWHQFPAFPEINSFLGTTFSCQSGARPTRPQTTGWHLIFINSPLFFPWKIEWYLTNGPLSKVLEILDTQV